MKLVIPTLVVSILTAGVGVFAAQGRIFLAMITALALAGYATRRFSSDVEELESGVLFIGGVILFVAYGPTAYRWVFG